MIIGIHVRKGSFSDKWISYCEDHNIDYRVINVFSNTIITQILKIGITHFMWHINHSNSTELRLFPHIMNSIEQVGVRCFPNFNSRWHFDDKVAQKYLLESIKAPMVPCYAFYNKETALEHISTINFPIVSKLTRGAGASNVKLLSNKLEAERVINLMFGEGINPQPDLTQNLNQKIRIAKSIKNPLQLLNKSFRFFHNRKSESRRVQNEKGYFYYQEFIPENSFDVRVIIIGNKAFAIKRLNRENDFRASGSGKIIYDHSQIDNSCIKISFNVSKRLEFDCIAFDYVFDQNSNPLIVEMCFGFTARAYDSCPGYWDTNLGWHKSKVTPEEWMIKNFIHHTENVKD